MIRLVINLCFSDSWLYDTLKLPLESTIKYYMEKNEIGNREYKEALKFNKNGILRELQSIENQINVV